MPKIEIDWDKFSASEQNPEKRRRKSHMAQAVSEMFTGEFALAMAEVNVSLDGKDASELVLLKREIMSLCRSRLSTPKAAMLMLFRIMLELMCAVTYEKEAGK